MEAFVQSNFGPAFRATVNRSLSKRLSRSIAGDFCKKRFVAASIAISTNLMRWFTACGFWFQNVSKSSSEGFQGDVPVDVEIGGQALLTLSL